MKQAPAAPAPRPAGEPRFEAIAREVRRLLGVPLPGKANPGEGPNNN